MTKKSDEALMDVTCLVGEVSQQQDSDLSTKLLKEEETLYEDQPDVKKIGNRKATGRKETGSGDSTDSMEFSDPDAHADLLQDQTEEMCDEGLKHSTPGNPSEGVNDVIKSEPSPEPNVIKTEDVEMKEDIKQESMDEPSTSSVRHTEPPAQPTGLDSSKKLTRNAPRLRHTRSARFPSRPGIVWREGAKLEAQDFQDKWYSAKILEIDATDDTVLIHFDGWNSRFDEWMPMASERLRCIPRHSERKDTRSRSQLKAEYKLGQCVFAKWTDCRMYPGKIERINANGSYEVLFYDGFKKTVQPINIKTMPPEVKQQYAKAGLLPEPGKKNKFPIREIAKEIQEKKKEQRDIKEGEKQEDEEARDTGEEQEGKRVGEKRRKSIEAAIALKKSKMEGEKLEKKERRSSRDGRGKEGREKKDTVKQRPVKEIKTSPSSTAATEVKVEGKTRSCKIVPTPPSRDLLAAHGTRDAQEADVKGKKDGEKTSKQTSARSSLGSPTEPAGSEPPGTEVYKCPFAMCTKSFRKQSNVDNHVKYFHTEDGTPVQPAGPRKRTKTTSVCSEDSELSLSTGGGARDGGTRDGGVRDGGVKSGGRKGKKRDRVILDLQQAPVDDDGVSNADTKTTTTEEYQAELYSAELSHTEDGGPEVHEGESEVHEGGPGVHEGVERIEKDEVVNCICQINEENGLMIQCDVCLCWQHALCMELTEETLPAKYMCVVCTNPPGVRDSARFSYDQDWIKHGMMQSFSFLPPDAASVKKSEIMRVTHGLVADVLNAKSVLKASELQLDALKKKNNTELDVWRRISNDTPGPVSTVNAASTSQHTTDATVKTSLETQMVSQPDKQTEDPLAAVNDRTEKRTKKDGEDPESPESTHTDSTVSAEEVPASGEDSLLQYVDSLHDNIEARLDLIEEQVARLEAAEERQSGKSQSGGDVLKDLPKVKRSLHYILSDLGKVKRLSLHHS